MMRQTNILLSCFTRAGKKTVYNLNFKIQAKVRVWYSVMCGYEKGVVILDWA